MSLPKAVVCRERHGWIGATAAHSTVTCITVILRVLEIFLSLCLEVSSQILSRYLLLFCYIQQHFSKLARWVVQMTWAWILLRLLGWVSSQRSIMTLIIFTNDIQGCRFADNASSPSVCPEFYRDTCSEASIQKYVANERLSLALKFHSPKLCITRP